MVLRDGAESQCAECKHAKHHSAEPNVKLLTLHSAELSNCRCYKMPNIKQCTEPTNCRNFLNNHTQLGCSF
jgi:hypothetical protein